MRRAFSKIAIRMWVVVRIVRNCSWVAFSFRRGRVESQSAKAGYVFGSKRELNVPGRRTTAHWTADPTV